MNSSLALFSVLYLVVLLELVFSVFFIQSDGFGCTLASQRWHKKYWHPINSFGYRDYEPVWKDKLLFIVGDSFVTGHGVKHISDRFSNQLAEKLGDTWTVTILAKNGWNLTNEYNALLKHYKKPDRIIVSYYINDIEFAAYVKGLKRPKILVLPPKYIRPLVNRSFFFNWIYWRVYRKNLGSNLYWAYLKRAYHNNEIWEYHKHELLNLIKYADRIHSQIAFVVWPNLKDVKGSREFTSKVVDFLRGKGVKALDLAKYFEGRESKQLVINSVDAHPNEHTHSEVARLLYNFLSPWDTL